MILGIDPGNRDSGYAIFREGQLSEFGKKSNYEILRIIEKWKSTYNAVLGCEMIQSYGNVVGATTFETCFWIGRFVQAWGGRTELIYRREIKQEICGSAKTKDKDVRAELIQMYGPGELKAIGTKKQPGPLYGMHNDAWQALAVAIYTRRKITDTLGRQLVMKIAP